MAKKIFTNIDFSKNAALNFVIGSLSADPSDASVPGYTYYNTTRHCLRVYNTEWEDVISIGNGKVVSIVDQLPATGVANTIYLRPRNSSGNDVTYMAFAWDPNTSTYGQVSGYSIPVYWDDILDKPSLLNCTINDTSVSTDKALVLTYSD